MVVWTRGERYTFRDEEIDGALEAGKSADNQAEAWRRLEIIGEYK